MQPETSKESTLNEQIRLESEYEQRFGSAVPAVWKELAPRSLVPNLQIALEKNLPLPNWLGVGSWHKKNGKQRLILGPRTWWMLVEELSRQQSEN